MSQRIKKRKKKKRRYDRACEKRKKDKKVKCHAGCLSHRQHKVKQLRAGKEEA